MGKRKIRGLVLGYVEGISSKIFESYSRQIADLAGDKQGVYALYKGSRLYYVGLATNLKRRVNHHLRDKHKGKWDTFNLYLVRRSQHIRELESLILRIADPKGNSVKGKLPGAVNFERELKQTIKQASDDVVSQLFSASRSGSRSRSAGRAGKVARSRKGPTLAPYIKKRCVLRGWHKGYQYGAVVNAKGEVTFDGRIYNSPSMAGKAAIGRSCNGWNFWHYKNSNGEWERLRELRKEKR